MERYCCSECKKNQVKQCSRCKRPFDDLRYFTNPDDKWCSSCKINASSLKQSERKKKDKEIYKGVYSHLIKEKKCQDFILSKPMKGKAQLLLNSADKNNFANKCSLVSQISNCQIKPVKQQRKMPREKEKKSPRTDSKLSDHQSKLIADTVKEIVNAIEDKDKTNESEGSSVDKDLVADFQSEADNALLNQVGSEKKKGGRGSKKPVQPPKSEEEILDLKRKKTFRNLLEDGIFDLKKVAPEYNFSLYITTLNEKGSPSSQLAAPAATSAPPSNLAPVYVTNFNSVPNQPHFGTKYEQSGQGRISKGGEEREEDDDDEEEDSQEEQQSEEEEEKEVGEADDEGYGSDKDKRRWKNHGRQRQVFDEAGGCAPINYHKRNIHHKNDKRNDDDGDNQGQEKADETLLAWGTKRRRLEGSDSPAKSNDSLVTHVDDVESPRRLSRKEEQKVKLFGVPSPEELLANFYPEDKRRLEKEVRHGYFTGPREFLDHVDATDRDGYPFVVIRGKLIDTKAAKKIADRLKRAIADTAGVFDPKRFSFFEVEEADDVSDLERQVLPQSTSLFEFIQKETIDPRLQMRFKQVFPSTFDDSTFQLKTATSMWENQPAPTYATYVPNQREMSCSPASPLEPPPPLAPPLVVREGKDKRKTRPPTKLQIPNTYLEDRGSAGPSAPTLNEEVLRELLGNVSPSAEDEEKKKKTSCGQEGKPSENQQQKEKFAADVNQFFLPDELPLF